MSAILTDRGSLPLASLRLIVPPLQLVSAALWEIVRQGAVMYYGLLEEFVCTVLETVPELLTSAERVQLVMGLRAKVVLELCRSDDFASPQAIQPHLSRLNSYITNQDDEIASSEVKASVTNFLKLVHTLVEDRCQRDLFYQKMFSTVFGPQYDSALQALMRKFLFSLQKLLPVPNLEQTSLWLSLSPSTLKECVDFMNQPEPLSTLIQHHRHRGHKVPQASSSCGDDVILSSLSYRLPNVDGEALGSEPIPEKEESFSEPMTDVERDGEQHLDGLIEDQGASVEVILPPFDESESPDDDKKTLRRLKTGRRTTSKTFKCSHSKLKKHRVSQSGCFTNVTSRTNSARQRSVFKKLNSHPKPKTCVENNAAESDPTGLPNVDDSGLVCGKAFTYATNFDKHQKTFCKEEAEIDPQCSSLAHNSEPNPVHRTEGSFRGEAGTGPSDSSREQTSKRSSRVKQCSVCGEIFTCSADLMRHTRSHAEQSPQICSYCGEDFDSYEDGEAHREGRCRVSNQHWRDNPSSDASKRDHENAVVSAQIPASPDASAAPQAKSALTCQECGQGFTYHKNFEKHQSKCSQRAPRRKKRTNINHSIIDACNFRSADVSSETEDSQTAHHTDGSRTKSIRCTMCDRNFSEIVLMKRHYSMSHRVRGSYPCPLCKRTFVRLCELVRHQQNKRQYQCAACKKCFTKPGLLRNHEKAHSASVTPRVCETCGKGFKYLAHLILHQRKHKERPPIVCSDCGKQFSNKDNLRAHMVRHTGGYPCPVCGKKFYQKIALKWHLYKHTGQEPYLCDTCGKGWPCAAQLRLHMVQHTEERPFACEDCGVRYKRASHLTAHRRSKHVGLRPFVCDVCGKAFRLNCDLRKHAVVHTKERPFKCPRCDKTFARKCRLREHREKACL